MIAICCRYVTQNMIAGDRLVPRMRKDLPWYLKNRPPWFISHCYKALIKADAQFDSSNIRRTNRRKVWKVCAAHY